MNKLKDILKDEEIARLLKENKRLKAANRILFGFAIIVIIIMIYNSF